MLKKYYKKFTNWELVTEKKETAIFWMAVSEYSIVIFIFISEELSNSYSCKFFEHFIWYSDFIKFIKMKSYESILINSDQFWSFVILYNQVIQFWYLSAFSSLLNLLINECFFTHFLILNYCGIYFNMSTNAESFYIL